MATGLSTLLHLYRTPRVSLSNPYHLRCARLSFVSTSHSPIQLNRRIGNITTCSITVSLRWSPIFFVMPKCSILCGLGSFLERVFPLSELPSTIAPRCRRLSLITRLDQIERQTTYRVVSSQWTLAFETRAVYQRGPSLAPDLTLLIRITWRTM